MKTFPTVVAGIFVALALFAVFIFATFSSHQSSAVGAVTVWGSLPDTAVKTLITDIQQNAQNEFDGVQYVNVPADTLVPSLISAIASGKGPDLVILPASYLIAQSDTLLTVPYSNFSQRDFKDAYIQAGEVLLQPDGIKGLPFMADPLVMYWNRTLFSNAGLSQPPQYWDEVATDAPKLTKTAGAGTLLTSAAALGTWDNITHAKEIFVSILRQLGNTVITQGDRGYQSSLQQSSVNGVASGDSALRFYTEFADPVKPVYSWNRSQPNSYDAFVGGETAMYFGRASELSAIRAANPNLNFDVAQLPSIRGGGNAAEAGLSVLAIPRGSANPKGALVVAEALTGTSVQSVISETFHLPSVRRDALSQQPADAYAGLFQKAALTAFSFPDPNPARTDDIFSRMVNAVASGASTVSDAISNASNELSALLGVQ